ncbi:DUF2489 domain-containing protein [Phytohalomonas tamaricis]|uniref:DUF2489 domain-containing protein n=1 Tax=Phytohalomonas tamaricis TaxID=2081032 RepID=UPI000D0B2A18|nr:DUF2489 domain-containing protein [Phytohalomonas tamaricis]
MTMPWAWALLVSGFIIVVILGLYVRYLIAEIKRREAFRRNEVRRAHDNCAENLDVIARAMLADQVDLVEGCLRCRVMLDIMDPTLLRRDELQIFQHVSNQAAHLHTHQARNELTPRERMQEDRERMQLMALNREKIRDGARNVMQLIRTNRTPER